LQLGCDTNSIESCFKEAIALCHFNHERVLTPIGVCIEDNGFPLVILPLMTNGDLLSYLRNKNIALTLKQLLIFAQQIAEGMQRKK